ncbi:hypothetical protein G5I_03994 [Acromyrmex echinatior]|uniref:Uncharacterized protein n=1 Tax=Acromyrmex echinatior TaxID=103372 RepID=F4WEI8_ACREC|nr:hypothetical protein G5I_03994 [Acromyrmex echinatior]
MRRLLGSPTITEPPKRATNGPKDGEEVAQFAPVADDIDTSIETGNIDTPSKIEEDEAEKKEESGSCLSKTWEADLTASLIQDEKDRMAEQFQITVPDLLLQACREFSRMEGRRSFRTARLRSASGRHRFRPVCQRPATRRPHAR